MIERISGGSHPCSCCHGNGFFWGEDHAERVKVDCPVCKGSGQLDAMITIEWKPCI
jgi:DnaJ-class molecular chaperone